MISEVASKLKQLQIANQKLERNSRGSVFESVHEQKVNTQGTEYSAGDSEALVEETTLIRLQQGGLSMAPSPSTSNSVSATPTANGSTKCSVNVCAMLLFVLLVIKSKFVNL